MSINTVQNFNGCYKATLANGTVMIVPLDTGNTDYQKILRWVSAGGVIA